MNQDEVSFWNLIKKHVPGDACRVENYADTGIPDVSACWTIDYWIELKVCNNKKKHREPKDLLRDSQKVWHYRRGKQGSIIFVMVKYSDSIDIFTWQWGKSDGILYTYEPRNIIRKEKGRFNWEQFKDVIMSVIKERTKTWSM